MRGGCRRVREEAWRTGPIAGVVEVGRLPGVTDAEARELEALADRLGVGPLQAASVTSYRFDPPPSRRRCSTAWPGRCWPTPSSTAGRSAGSRRPSAGRRPIPTTSPGSRCAASTPTPWPRSAGHGCCRSTSPRCRPSSATSTTAGGRRPTASSRRWRRPGRSTACTRRSGPASTSPTAPADGEVVERSDRSTACWPATCGRPPTPSTGPGSARPSSTTPASSPSRSLTALGRRRNSPGGPGFDLAIKVETHNHPSALEPFGGANTGVGGVVRDVIGVSARPIACLDVLCFAPATTPAEAVPEGVLHPRRVAEGVVAGIGDYGNKLGLPTVAGAVVYHPGYLGNPLVFCGAVGLLPHGSHPSRPQPGDLVVVVGGRTGRDGIHGATFSSADLSTTTGTTAASAVQIGDPITEKQVLELVEEARDRALYSAITDCGAGGLSSAVGELASEVGVEVDLAVVPRKYPGLLPWEVWLSESQERMVPVGPAGRLARAGRSGRAAGRSRPPPSAGSPATAACGSATATSTSSTCRWRSSTAAAPAASSPPSGPIRRPRRSTAAAQRCRPLPRRPPTRASTTSCWACWPIPPSPPRRRSSAPTTTRCAAARWCGRGAGRPATAPATARSACRSGTGTAGAPSRSPWASTPATGASTPTAWRSRPSTRPSATSWRWAPTPTGWRCSTTSAGATRPCPTGSADWCGRRRAATTRRSPTGPRSSRARTASSTSSRASRSPARCSSPGWACSPTGTTPAPRPPPRPARSSTCWARPGGSWAARSPPSTSAGRAGSSRAPSTTRSPATGRCTGPSPAGLVLAAHDPSEGGLAVALAELCLAGRLGLDVDVPAVTCPPWRATARRARVAGLRVQRPAPAGQRRQPTSRRCGTRWPGLPLRRLGTTTSADRLRVRYAGQPVVDLHLDDLVAAWHGRSRRAGRPR